MSSQAKIYDVLSELFSDVFMRDDIVLKPELAAQDVAGWDSLKQIEILIAVESRFGIKLATREVDGLRCVGDLAAIIERKTI